MPAYLETPSEIWHTIFETVTEVPDPLACFAQDYYGSREDVLGPPYQRYKVALATKLALCAVSRHWNAVATPLLYDRIIISSHVGDYEEIVRQFNLLYRSLSSSPLPEPLTGHNRSNEESGPENRTRRLGNLVRRLDLSFWDDDEESNHYVDFVRSTISRLAEELPNLEVLGLRVPSSVTPFDALRVLSTRLKHMHWRRSGLGPDPPIPIPIPSLLDFLDSHTALETFHMVADLEMLDLGLASASLWAGQSYPSIRHWVLRDNHIDILADVPFTVFPNLEVMTFPLYSEVNANVSRIAKILQVHGSQLTSIRLNPDRSLKELLRTVGRWCPCLKEVNLVYTWRWRWPTPSSIASASATIKMPRVTVLGLIFCDYGPSVRHSSGWQRVVMLRWKDLFPNLLTIRLADELDVARLRELSGGLEMQKAIRHWSQQNVVLENNFGLPLA